MALNIATLGGKTMLIGVVGDDAAGAEMTRLVEAAGGIACRLVVAPDRPTTAKTRFMAGSHQLLRLDEETTEQLTEDVAAAVLEHFDAGLDWADVVVLSDYAKGVLGGPVLAAILARAEARGCLVVVDPKRPDFAAYRGATILTPNEHEVRLATGIGAEHDTEADRAGRAALDATGGEAVLVDPLRQGATLVRRGRGTASAGTASRGGRLSGAGDTTVAALAVALGAGASLPDAAMLANLTAGISVGKQGTATVSREELLGRAAPGDLVATDRKVATAETRRCGWRRGVRMACASASPTAAST